MRKYNKILSCDKTPNGYWHIIVISPYDQIHQETYIGYSKADALKKARRTDFDKEKGLLFEQRPKRSKKQMPER